MSNEPQPLALLTRRQIIGGAPLLSVAALVNGGCATAPKVSTMAHDAAASVMKLVPVPTQAVATEGHLQLSDVRLWYWDTGGNGEPIVLLHPYTGSAASWAYQQPVFAQAGYRVIGYSRRGHYRSDTGPMDANVPASVDLADLVDRLDLDRFHLIGSAAGAIVAADFAVSHPQRLRTLTLASSILGVRDELMDKALRALIPENFSTLPPDFRELSPSYRVANPEGTRHWLDIEAQARSAVLPRGVSRNEVRFETLAACGIPMLLMTGDADLYMPPALLQLVGQRLPQAQVAFIKNAGHAAFWEQPAAFNQLVLNFLKQHRS